MHRFLIVFCLALLSACGSRMPLVERLDADELFARGVERMEARRWDAAIEAFERFSFRFPGHPLQQEARFRLAESYFGKREHLTAATEYIRFAIDYPNSQWSDHARFGACRAYHQLAPPPVLDQQYTFAAIEHCGTMAEYYPESQFAPRAREIVVEMTNRLAEKEFNAAEHYLRRRAYDSAIMYYAEVIAAFPATPSAPRALLRLVEVYDRLGWEAEEAAARQRLLRDYPTSAEAREIAQRQAVTGPP
jgi:outer membrane protein assembly factor BamD